MAQVAQDGQSSESTFSIQRIQPLPASRTLPSLNNKASVESTNLCQGFVY